MTVAAVPVVFWFSVGNVQLVRVPLEGVPSAPPETKLPEAVPVNAPTKVVAVIVPVVANLDSSIAAEAFMSALRIVPSRIIVLVTVPVSADETRVPLVGKVTVVVPV